MKVKAVLLILCALSTAGAEQTQQVVEMQPGLWELRLLKMAMDGEDWLEQQRAKTRTEQERQMQLPPGQRRQVRDPLVFRWCERAGETMLDEWLISQNVLGKDDECMPPKVIGNGKRIMAERICTGYTMKIETAMPNKTNVEMIVTFVFPEPGGYTMVQEMHMKFLDSDCGGVAPFKRPTSGAGMP
ncbi:MAG: hypothetical protein FWH15_04730 [Betaproteobacteria bacterium]|nr:hypothetical protein [Betaproteobacteria bacterium]